LLRGLLLRTAACVDGCADRTVVVVVAAGVYYHSSASVRRIVRDTASSQIRWNGRIERVAVVARVVSCFITLLVSVAVIFQIAVSYLIGAIRAAIIRMVAKVSMRARCGIIVPCRIAVRIARSVSALKRARGRRLRGSLYAGTI